MARPEVVKYLMNKWLNPQLLIGFEAVRDRPQSSLHAAAVELAVPLEMRFLA